MKPMTFTTQERTLLIDLLKDRLEFWYKDLKEFTSVEKTQKKRFENQCIVPDKSALDKISRFETAEYSSKEKLSIISCINSHWDDFRKELQLATPLSWLTISGQQRKVVEKLDRCLDILSKCGSYSQKYSIVKSEQLTSFTK
ncbi:MAG: hypothetical protein U1C46_01295 [Bacteroidales bacterium]|nr:hypothetical protein [Bacteroidales bacterium]